MDKLHKNTLIRNSPRDRRDGNPARPVPGESAATCEAGIKLHEGYVIKGGKRTVYEHREVISKLLGRPLTSDEIVHHWNEIRTENNPENLELTTRSAHQGWHMLVRFLNGCKRGHPWENNSYFWNGKRKCRTCHLERSRQRYLARKCA